MAFTTRYYFCELEERLMGGRLVVCPIIQGKVRASIATLCLRNPDGSVESAKRFCRVTMEDHSQLTSGPLAKFVEEVPVADAYIGERMLMEQEMRAGRREVIRGQLARSLSDATKRLVDIIKPFDETFALKNLDEMGIPEADIAGPTKLPEQVLEGAQ